MAKRLSVVLPCFNEESNILPMVQAFAETGLASEYDPELIFVDDGSEDGTWKEIQKAAGRVPWAKGIRLSRNFGQQAALLAGLRAARGDVVVTMDADLQHPPALIRKLLEHWKEGAELVTTVREFVGTEPFFKRMASRLFYQVFRKTTGLPIVPGQADFRLFDRKVVQAILAIRETGVFLRGLVSWIGFRQATVRYQAADRHAGETKYTLRRMVLLAVEGMFSFSNVPLRMGFALGTGLIAVSVVLAIAAWAMGSAVSAGFFRLWGSLTATFSFLLGILLLYLGIIGEYLARVYLEAKGRPQYLIAETTGDRPPDHSTTTSPS